MLPRIHRLRLVAGVSLTAALAAGLITAPAAWSSDSVDSAESVRASGLSSTVCKKARGVAGRVRVDAGDFADTGWVQINNWRVKPSQVNWQSAHPRHAIYTVVFHSSAWLIPQSPQDIGPAIDAMVQQAQRSPDPGNVSSNRLNKSGWKESHTTKRLNTATCLYSVAQNDEQREAMTEVIEQLAAANMDENRYYGPPLRKPHNHGIMADQALSEAARRLARPDWTDVASQRVAAQLSETFDTCGMTFEQSSAYLSLHVRLWDAVRRWTDPQAAQRITAILGEARHARNLLTRPDGELVRIGDGRERSYATRASIINDQLWCPESGWYAATSNRNKKAQHTVVRFGPSVDTHGHDDRGQVVWWTGDSDSGVPVLSDRGTYQKTDFKRTDYAHSSQAHSTLQWRGSTGRQMNGELQSGRKGTVITLDSSQSAGDWTRVIFQTTNRYRLVVTDDVTSTSALGRIAQRFTLDPVWSQQKNRSPKRAVFVTETGWKAQLTCTVDDRRINPRVVTAEHFPARDRIERALSVDCGTANAGSQSSLRAVVKVTPPKKN